MCSPFYLRFRMVIFRWAQDRLKIPSNFIFYSMYKNEGSIISEGENNILNMLDVIFVLTQQSRHPPTQWNLTGGRWSSVEKSTIPQKVPFMYQYPCIPERSTKKQTVNKLATRCRQNNVLVTVYLSRLNQDSCSKANQPLFQFQHSFSKVPNHFVIIHKEMLLSHSWKPWRKLENNALSSLH